MRRLTDIPLAAMDRLAVSRAADMLRDRFDVDRVILFGSKACGTDHADSDIDLVVLTRDPIGPADKARINDALFDLQAELGVLFSPLTLWAKEWDVGYLQAMPIRAEVDRDGVLI